MKQDKLNEILRFHALWLRGDGNGQKANLCGAFLACANLIGANLRCADLRSANLSGANLPGADLRYADISGVNLSGANLRDADFSGANLRNTNLSGANLSGADFSGANLSGTDLRSTNLSGANLSGADLSGANLSGTDLSGANLSGAIGLLSAVDYMAENFERTADGYIAYKLFGFEYDPPTEWTIKKGSIIQENVFADRCHECGCGINVATLDWMQSYLATLDWVQSHCSGIIWKVLIRWEWLCGVCVPYNTDGKIRCEKVELLEVVV